MAGGGYWGSIAGAGRSWCGLWPAMIAMVSGKHPPGASSLLCSRGHDGAGSEQRGEPGVTQPERSPAWLCIHCDKAEWFFGPEPLARLSAHHAPFPSLVTPGRHPFLPGGLGGCRAPAMPPGRWGAGTSVFPLAFGESLGSGGPGGCVLCGWFSALRDR